MIKDNGERFNNDDDNNNNDNSIPSSNKFISSLLLSINQVLIEASRTEPNRTEPNWVEPFAQSGRHNDSAMSSTVSLLLQLATQVRVRTYKRSLHLSRNRISAEERANPTATAKDKLHRFCQTAELLSKKLPLAHVLGSAAPLSLQGIDLFSQANANARAQVPSVSTLSTVFLCVC